MRALRRALIPLAWACFFVVLGSYLGALHPVGDTLAIAAPLAAPLGVFAGMATQGGIRIFLVLCCLSGGLHWSLQLRQNSGPPGDYIVYQKNVWAPNDDLVMLADEIISQNPDFVTLQEVADNRHQLLEILKTALPHVQLCPFEGWSGVAVLSKHPFVEDSPYCSTVRGMAAARAITPEGEVWIASAHLWWPYPFEQSAKLDPILPRIRLMEGPVIIGGDFNMFPGTRITREIAQASGSKELRPAFPTMRLAGLGLPIDHILAPSGRVERRPLAGSDHYGLVAHVDF